MTSVLWPDWKCIWTLCVHPGCRSSRPEVFCKKFVLRNFTKFTGTHLCQSLFFNKVAGLRPATLLKKRLWCRSLPVNFVKFLRTPFYRTPMDDCFWLSQFHLRRFVSLSLCLSLSRFPNIKIKLSTVTSETRKYFIHSNRLVWKFNNIGAPQNW